MRLLDEVLYRRLVCLDAIKLAAVFHMRVGELIRKASPVFTVVEKDVVQDTENHISLHGCP